MNAEVQFPKIRVVLRAGMLVREDLYKMSPPTPTKENFKPSAISQIDRASANHPAHGLVLPPEDNSDPLDTMAREILDDTTFNILHELLQEVHRSEKVARCNTAAMHLEQKAQKDLDHDSSTTNENLNIKAFEAGIKTDLVRFDEDGNTTLIQDGKFPPILEAVKVAHCPDCHLPRFPYPSIGEGSRAPEPGIEYCKKHVFVSNKPADIYNQRYDKDVRAGKGKPKPKTEGEKLVPDKPVKCPISGCNKTEKITRMGHHLSFDHGNRSGRRAAGKDAMEKIKNNANGNASSGSRKSTPTATATPNGRSSPNKRDLDDIDSDDSPHLTKKSKSESFAKKPQSLPKSQTSSQHSSSNLNHVETQMSDDDLDDDDDHRDGDFSASFGDPKKRKKSPPKLKSAKPKSIKPIQLKAKIPAAKNPAGTISSSAKKARSATPSESKPKVKPGINGNGKAKSAPRDSSESSQTMSSPN